MNITNESNSYIASLATEQRNLNTMNIDEVSTLEMVKLINSEDKTVPLAVEKELANIAMAIDYIYSKVKQGGRLFYIGAGTSGRLGILDASECPPTYGVSSDVVIAVMAGGINAIKNAAEGNEDNKELCISDLKAYDFNKNDVLVGIAASGRTPYVIGGMEYAKELGSIVISLTCSPNSEMSRIADVAITPIVGGEVVTGSTRMKSGTAQKLVLNMLSTGLMIKLGKVYENLMVDLKPSNEKLITRCENIVVNATGCSIENAKTALSKCEYHPKTAIVMILSDTDTDKAKKALLAADGLVRNALDILKK